MHLKRIQVRNYRVLKKVDLEIGLVNVFFGQNGAGKSSLLDALWFLRDCAVRDVEFATSTRHQGIGLLWDGVPSPEDFTIGLETQNAKYLTKFRLVSGRVDPRPGEILVSSDGEGHFFRRDVGTTILEMPLAPSTGEVLELREPEKLSLTPYFHHASPMGRIGALEVDYLIRATQYFDASHASLRDLRRRGSETNPGTRLTIGAENLWSVLRNLSDRRDLDDRYSTIVGFMKKAFPKSQGLFLEQTGSAVVIGHFLEAGRSEPIPASSASDGYLQLLILLTALFSEGKQPGFLMFDEPETSLHPYAMVVLAEAIEEATANWGKQVMLATHSPVLLSQFSPEQMIAVEPGDEGEALFRRVSEIDEISDLLDEYALGALYMAEAVAAQSSSGRS